MGASVNESFLIACEDGDIEKVKELYAINYSNKTIFEKFTNIFSSHKKPLLDIHARLNLPFLSACNYGHLDIVQFLLERKTFTNKIPAERLIRGFGSAIENGHMTVAKFLLPFIKKRDQDFEDVLYSSFQSCCKKGQLDSLKFIVNDLGLRNNDEILSYDEGFIKACENGQINIIEYLLKEIKIPKSIPEKLIKNPKYFINIKDEKVLHYFVNELNMKKNDGLYSRLILDTPMVKALSNAWEKKKIFHDLSANLTTQSSILPKANKKLKL